MKLPDNWQITSDWDSHRPLLYLAATLAEWQIVEFGCGDGSTNLLDEYCRKKAIDFISVDSDYTWASKFKPTHYVDNILSDINFLNNIDVLFIDSKPGEERKYLVDKYTNLARIIVIHDTEESANYVYGLKNRLESNFKYRLDFKPKGKPHSTLVSNIVDVTKLKIPE